MYVWLLVSNSIVASLRVIEQENICTVSSWYGIVVVLSPLNRQDDNFYCIPLVALSGACISN